MLNPIQMLRMLKSNPKQILSQMYNVPQNLNDPQQIIQYLLNSGQITQDQVNNAMNMRNNPMFSGLLK